MFTKLKSGYKAVLWDGDYELYRKLTHEPMFVGVLHNPDSKKEILKVWDDPQKEWVDCEPGNYVLQDDKGFFHVATRELVNEMRN